MTDLPIRAKPATHAPRHGIFTRLALSPGFHALAARVPMLRRLALNEGRALFSVVSGFVQSQVLMALVHLDILEMLRSGGLPTASLATRTGVAGDRIEVLLRAAAALRLIRQNRDGRWCLRPRGAAFLTVPGLKAMVRHHDVLYRDLADPVAFLRAETTPELARFWPYVFGAGAASEPQSAQVYSQLMYDSQALVAADTLAVVDLSGVTRLMDVGGGTGAFLTAVARRCPKPDLVLFDLPAVVAEAGARFAQAGLAGRVTIVPGSFRDAPLPKGADAISLVRVLYDHADETVEALLHAAFSALPSGGRLVVSEPMSGGITPDPATDVYFAFYTLAMGTGRTRSAQTLAGMLKRAGFARIVVHAPRRSFVTQVISASKP